jgi:hypothetical protein
MYPYYYPSYYNPSKQGAAGGIQPDMEFPGQGMPMGQGTPVQGIPGTTSGQPVGPIAPPSPTIQPPPVDFQQEPGPPVTTDIGYTQAYLKTQIGKRCKVEFLIGTNLLTDRSGTLVDVGISYILLRLQESDDIMLGDIYSIKFVTFFR